MRRRLDRADYRFLAVCLALLAATTWFSVRNFYRAFPEASIDFRVSRAEGETVASRFLGGRGYDLAPYRKASSFRYDDTAKTFLEREAGPEQANRLLGSTIRMWRWSYRWFRPLQKEEFRAEVTPRGELVEFAHELPEDAPRGTATAEQARTTAEAFLRSAMNRDPASLEFIESSEAARPKRVDRVFTWEERGFRLKDATYRVEVTVLGDEVGGYREYLKVPEQWTRDYRRLRSKNEAASTVDVVLMSCVFVGLLVVIAMRVRGHDIRWRRAATVGVIGMALGFLAQLNQLPLQEFEYPTTDSYGSFMLRQILNALFASLGSGGLLFVLTAGAEPLYREMFPGQVSLGNLFRPASLRTRRFFLGAVLGVSLTGIFVAYQTAFYMVAYRYGAWSPADVPYSDLLNTRLPWAFVLFGGFLPAVSEEFMFRMFAIPFLRKVTRSIVAALLLAGFIWGFGHAAYPQQPFWIRGVEVGIGGVALGMVMLRWGILPTLVWHYSVDAMYTAMLLLRSPNLYLRISGVVSAGIVLLPIAVALAAYWRRGGFDPEEGLLNGDETTEAPPAVDEAAEVTAEESERNWPSLPRWAMAGAGLLLVAGIAALLIPVERFGAAPRYRIPDSQALAAADAFLRAQNLDPGWYEHVVFPAAHWEGADEAAAKYFLERQPLAAASSMFERYRPIQHWVVRYFKPLSQDEALVTVHPETGKVMAFRHQIPEDQPGLERSEADARTIAAAFAKTFGWDTAAMELKESNSEKKKARRDYTFVWEARDGDPRNVDQARFRVEVGVLGMVDGSARAYWKLPESYTRAREQQNFLSIATAVGRIAVFATGLVAAIWMLVKQIRNGAVRWRKTLRIAIPAAVLSGVGPLLSLRTVMQRYPTEVPIETFRALSYMAVLVAVVFGFVAMGGAVALVTSYYPDALAALRPGNRRALARDASVALAAAAGIGLLLYRVDLALLARFHAQALLSIAPPAILASAAPSVAAAANGVRTVLFLAAVLATAALAMRGRPWLLPLIALALLPGDIRTAGEFALHYGIAALAVATAWGFCRYFARANYLAYAVVLWFLALRGPLGELYDSPRQPHFWILAAILAAGLIWALLPVVRKRAVVA
jgi:membrane protease YdiL (CAAX protease family)